MHISVLFYIMPSQVVWIKLECLTRLRPSLPSHCKTIFLYISQTIFFFGSAFTGNAFLPRSSSLFHKYESHCIRKKLLQSCLLFKRFRYSTLCPTLMLFKIEPNQTQGKKLLPLICYTIFVLLREEKLTIVFHF